MVVVGEVGVEEDPVADENHVSGLGSGDADDMRGIEDAYGDGDDELRKHDGNTSLCAVWLMFDGSGLT